MLGVSLCHCKQFGLGERSRRQLEAVGYQDRSHRIVSQGDAGQGSNLIRPLGSPESILPLGSWVAELKGVQGPR